jgi:hypothetical protein
LDNQVRGFAWVIRDLANTAAYLPDNHPLKNYFVEKIGNNLTWLEQHCGPEGLGIVSAFKDYWPMNSSDPSHVYISPWQEQYVAWAIDNANRQGFVGALNVRDTVARFSLSLLTHDVDFRQYGGPYYMIVGDRNTTTRQITWYTTWDQVHQANGWTPGGVSSAPLTGYYGPEARIMSMINLQNNVPRAQEAYDYLWPLVAIQPHRGGIPDIIDRSNLALDFDTPGLVGNRPPVVYAGPNKSIGAAPISFTLQGSAADDNLPNPPAQLTIQWSKVSGSGNVVFANPSSPTSSVSFSADGLYVLRLSANDSALTSTDDVTIGVNTQAPAPGPGPSPAPTSFVFRNQIVKGDGPAKFEFALKNAGPVEIDIVDRSGKIITTLNEDRLAGDNTMLWDMKNVPSGTFFALLKTPEKKEKAKIVHIR